MGTSARRLVRLNGHLDVKPNPTSSTSISIEPLGVSAGFGAEVKDLDLKAGTGTHVKPFNGGYVDAGSAPPWVLVVPKSGCDSGSRAGGHLR
jgi:hypothetical protein